ncbi:hypothetical protein D3C73_1193840 [compost metagenome]
MPQDEESEKRYQRWQDQPPDPGWHGVERGLTLNQPQTRRTNTRRQHRARQHIRRPVCTEVNAGEGDRQRRQARHQQPGQAHPWRLPAAGQDGEGQEQCKRPGCVAAGHAVAGQRVAQYLRAHAAEKVFGQGVAQRGAEQGGGGEDQLAPLPGYQ